MGGDVLPSRDRVIIYDIRMPRMIMGVLVGAALAVAGAVMQGLFRNPLADPGLIGVGAGAIRARVRGDERRCVRRAEHVEQRRVVTALRDVHNVEAQIDGEPLVLLAILPRMDHQAAGDAAAPHLPPDDAIRTCRLA